MSMRKSTVAMLLVMLMILPIAITVSAEEQPLSPTINTSWLKGSNGLNEHAYTITFEDNGSYQSNFTVTHERAGQTLENTLFTTWSSVDEQRVARILANTSLEWGDEISVAVSVTSWNGNPLQQPLESERSFTVGTWNQPMADHEVLLKTGWNLDQTYTNEDGEQGFALNFSGQGWQLREGNVLNSWELGNGTLTTLENTEDGVTNLTLDLESIWKNETVQSGVLTSQVFDARGSGVLHLVTFDGESQSTVTANVSD